MKCSAAEREGSHCGGYLTVALSLILTLCLSLFFALFSGARKGLVREQAELVTDLAADSVLAEYSQALFDRYALLFADCSYQTDTLSEDAVTAHLLNYAQRNLMLQDPAGPTSAKSFTGLSVSDLTLLQTRYASDAGGLPVREEIAAYMTADPLGEAAGEGTSLLSSWKGLSIDLPELTGNGGSQTSAWEKSREENQREIGEAQEQLEENGAGETDAEDSDPAKMVDEFRKNPVLDQVLDRGTPVSDSSVALEELPSHRNLHAGTGLVPANVRTAEEPNAVLLDAYLAEKCGCWQREKEGSRLSYELEYILFGKESDRDNLTSMAKELLLVRTVCNAAFLAEDGARRAAAESFALGISVVTANPALKEVFTAAVLLAWSYVESVQDVKTLLAGGKVPLVKTGADWSTDVDDILRPGSLTGRREGGRGLSYGDYLQIFLYLVPEKTKTARFLDVCEADIRCTEGNANFRIDWCLDAFVVRAEYAGSFGDRFAVEKEASYH